MEFVIDAETIDKKNEEKQIKFLSTIDEQTKNLIDFQMSKSIDIKSYKLLSVSSYIPDPYSKFLFYHNFIYDIYLYHFIEFNDKIISNFPHLFLHYYGSNIINDVSVRSTGTKKIVNGLKVINYFSSILKDTIELQNLSQPEMKEIYEELYYIMTEINKKFSFNITEEIINNNYILAKKNNLSTYEKLTKYEKKFNDKFENYSYIIFFRTDKIFEMMRVSHVKLSVGKFLQDKIKQISNQSAEY